MDKKFEGTDRRADYKYRGLTSEELRRRREENSVMLRQKAREDSLNKRRNIVDIPQNLDANGSMQPMSPSTTASSLGVGLGGGENIAAMVTGLNSNDYNEVLESITRFRKMLSKEQNPPIQDVIDCDVVPRFVFLLSGQLNAPPSIQEKIVFEAAWALTNIASGQQTHTFCVVEAGAVPVFIHLLTHSNADIREQSIWALGNIAGDSPQLRNLVLDHGIMANLLSIMESEMISKNPSLSLIRNSTWTLSNLCRGKPAPAWTYISPAIPVLRRLLECNDTETLSDSAWAVSYISDGPTEYISEIINAGIVGLLVELLSNRSHSVQTPCLRALGNIVTGNDAQTQVVIDSGALLKFHNLLRSPRTSIQKECCWAISNITAGTPEQIQAVIDSNLIPLVVSLLRSGDQKTKKEATWAICNATSHHDRAPQQIKYLVSQGCVKPLCDMLSGQDSKIVQVVLDGIDNILAVGQEEVNNGSSLENEYSIIIEDVGALDKIVELQDHAIEAVYLKSKGIIDKYYGGKEEEIMADDNDFDYDIPASTRPEGGFSF